jgi:CRISPR-associated protein Csb2
VDLDGDGRIDHLIVHAAMGLGDAAQRAIRTLRRTWVEQLLGPPQGSRVWESVTPFVPPRYLKARGRNTLVGQVNAELESRRLPSVERIDFDACAQLTRSLRHYVRRRYHGGMPPPNNIGYGLRLIFSEPLLGPLALGYAAHYGLGMFRGLKDD